MTDELALMAKRFRRDVFDFKTRSGYGHLASSLSCVDILVSLYLDPRTDFDHTRDVLIFGKGHGGPAVYPILAELGYFPRGELALYCHPDGILRLHPDGGIPGCEFLGGSLGNGIGYAAGRALARPDTRFWVLLGDAELYEGSVWESLLFISHHSLRNLGIIVDRNGLGILGFTEELLRLNPLAAKFESFGFTVTQCSGHSIDELAAALTLRDDQVHVVIAETIKGKGVSFMENLAEYHTIIPRDDDRISRGREELS